MSVLKIVDGLEMELELRALLRPDELVRTRDGKRHRLPRFFYEVKSWDQAKQTSLSPHFTLAELMTVDCREADLLFRQCPRYVPCALTMLARALEGFREAAGAPVFISANGGFRSPAHRRSEIPDAHCWGAAADVYRVGDTWLDEEGSIGKFGLMAGEACREFNVKDYGAGTGGTDDHLHLDLGYPRGVPAGVDET